MTPKCRILPGAAQAVSLSTRKSSYQGTLAFAALSPILNLDPLTPPIPAASPVPGREVHASTPVHFPAIPVPARLARLEILFRQNVSAADTPDLGVAVKPAGAVRISAVKN